MDTSKLTKAELQALVDQLTAVSEKPASQLTASPVIKITSDESDLIRFKILKSNVDTISTELGDFQRVRVQVIINGNLEGLSLPINVAKRLAGRTDLSRMVLITGLANIARHKAGDLVKSIDNNGVETGETREVKSSGFHLVETIKCAVEDTNEAQQYRIAKLQELKLLQDVSGNADFDKILNG